MTPQVHAWLESAEKISAPWEAKPESGSFGRLWRVFMTARVAIASVLVILQAFIYALGNITNRWSIAVCIAYLCATLVARLWARPRPHGNTFDAQWVSTIGVDVVTFSVLNFLSSGGINYTPLFALPVLLSSVLGPILLAFGTAASVTLLLLADAWRNSLQSPGDFNAHFLQAGLSGSGFFLVALLANQLVLRLAREEKLAKSSQSTARMLTQVNELVIETLADGVLVVDVNGMVRSANPASRRLLATQDAIRSAPFMLATEAAWQPLVELMLRTFTTQSPQEVDISLECPARNARRLHVRTRLAASQNNTHDSLCVMFLKDLREMEARVRTEKMAAMGRMSAAVAHEIRNPLAAISQANALLEEDLHDTGHRQLTAMVRQNAQRLAKIVDEVLNISRAQEQIPAPQTSTLMLDDMVLRIATDWARQTAATQRMGVTAGSANAAVWFDPEHLRRLMINLLDNALRYASTSAQAIEVTTQLVAPGQARLAVWSDGQALEKTVQTHLFEPFFSSESRSSGLGLYISRELCERYGALIGYQRVLSGGIEGNEFFVMFRPASQPLSADSLSFDAILV
ncbi:MAG TPA: PAS domain-containing sensor histidine kinase [Polaromonas sp.]|uniref:sensor histidine kinase n=1 Tax=Polaromonas sp. UBA4122 TaxID=1947074 RepID=UPI000EE6D1EB|nr:ATP-binding protein [Polaromonas sp. UBA4122]HAL36917.1 PAS domain-containing sensor histidine kinase [Polaromonas sp.]